jgi:hypothetical protein
LFRKEIETQEINGDATSIKRNKTATEERIAEENRMIKDHKEMMIDNEQQNNTTITNELATVIVEEITNNQRDSSSLTIGFNNQQFKPTNSAQWPRTSQQ